MQTFDLTAEALLPGTVREWRRTGRGTVAEIHGVVPGLNQTLGPAMRQMLSRLRPGQAWQRSNWGLAATAELNLHPALGRPVPEPPVRLDRLWLRVEEQLLMALPGVAGLVPPVGSTDA